MNDLMNMAMACVTKDFRRLERTELENGLFVSTVDTGDMGPETAIIDLEGNAHPVERYNSVERALNGHKNWVRLAKCSPKKIVELGYGELCGEREVELVYDKPSVGGGVPLKKKS